MSSTLYVIGAGLAGLSAAVNARKLGAQVKVFEASPKAGGRIRSVNGHDNGTHLLVKGYQSTFEYLQEIGNLDQIAPYPTKAYRQCEGPLNWDLPGRHIFGHVAKGAIPGVNLFNIFGKTAKRRLWDPFFLGVFNAPFNQVSGGLIKETVFEILKQGPDALEPYFARQTLEETFVNPVLDDLDIEFSQPLRKLEERQLVFKDKTISLGKDDKVILALPAQAYKNIELAIDLPDFEYSPITNIHFYPELAQRLRFFGLINTISQWVYTNGNHICVTISNHTADRQGLAAHVWKEICFHLDMAESGVPNNRIVCEKFATPLQTKSFKAKRLDVRTELPNVFLAGDWLNTRLPCTIEGAIRSGEMAVKAAFQ